MKNSEILVLLKGALAEILATGQSEGVSFGPDKEIDKKLQAAIYAIENSIENEPEAPNVKVRDAPPER